MARCHVNYVHSVIAIMYMTERVGASTRQQGYGYFTKKYSTMRTATKTP